jgi:hypothetical protein
MKTYKFKEALIKEINDQLESFIFEVTAEDIEDVEECLEYMDCSISKVKTNNIAAYRIARYLTNVNCLNPFHLLTFKNINKQCISYNNENNESKKLTLATSILTEQQKHYQNVLNDIELSKLNTKELIDIATVLMHQLYKAKYVYLPFFCSTEDSFDACIRCSVKRLAEAANFGRSWLLFEKKEQIEPFTYKITDIEQYRGSLKKTEIPDIF